MMPAWTGLFQELPGATVPTPPPSDGHTDASRPIKEGRAGCALPAWGQPCPGGAADAPLHPNRVQVGVSIGGDMGSPDPFYPPNQRPRRKGPGHQGRDPPAGPCTPAPSVTSWPRPLSSCAWGRMGCEWRLPPSHLLCPA